ncbi:MAG: 4-hydroxy-tetrahydrodipicolinate reductase [Christensenellales bacterium]|jgi:4-hydroxy-tetrahydrodipicolinate reductase
MVRILLHGCNGKMGQAIVRLCGQMDGLTVACGVDKFPAAAAQPFPVYPTLAQCREEADVIVDFSRPDGLDDLLAYALDKGLPVVACTTGLTGEQERRLVEASARIGVLKSANMSLGVNLMQQLSAAAARFLGDAYDIEILEKHHNQKVDAPSGTALALADAINHALEDSKAYVFSRHERHEKREKKELGISALRGGTVTGEHSVFFFGPDEVLEIRHTAYSRDIFAVGALRAARFMADKPSGFYTMQDLLGKL